MGFSDVNYGCSGQAFPDAFDFGLGQEAAPQQQVEVRVAIFAVLQHSEVVDGSVFLA